MSVKDKSLANTSITDKRLLIIDGHPIYIYKIDGFLGSLTFKNVHLARSATEGIEYASQEKPDLIILSGMLPDMDSAQACHMIKRSSPQTKIIIQIGLFTDSATMKRFMEAGADRVIDRKEKDLDPLARSIEELLS